MTRYSGIIVAVIGLILTVLGALKIVPYVTGTGIGLILLGGLLLGISFIPKPTSEETGEDVGVMSAIERLTKIFYAPAEVFQNLRRHPRWFGAILVMTIFSAGYIVAFKSHIGEETIVNFTIEKTKEMSMVANNPQALEGVEKSRKDTIESEKSSITKVTTFVTEFIKWVFLSVIIGLICWLFALAMGGKMNFWQAISTAVYAFFPVVVIHRLLSFLLLYLKDPIDIHPILGQSALVQDNLSFLASPKDNPVLYVLLGAFSLLMFYWVFLLATGMKNAGERVSSTTGWSAAITLYVIYILIGVASAFLFSGFMS